MKIETSEIINEFPSIDFIMAINSWGSVVVCRLLMSIPEVKVAPIKAVTSEIAYRGIKYFL